MAKQYIIRQTERVYRHNSLKPNGEWLIVDKSIAKRDEEQVAHTYHDMLVGETRVIANGFEIVRVS